MAPPEPTDPEALDELRTGLLEARGEPFVSEARVVPGTRPARRFSRFGPRSRRPRAGQAELERCTVRVVDSAGAEFNIGPHRLRITGDTVLTRYVGVPEFEQVLEIHRHLDRVKAEHGRLFVINDMRHSGVPATETRRFIAEWASRNVGTELVNFGMGLSIRAVQALLLRAAALLGKTPAIVPEHCEDEAAAYAWVAERRALRRR